MKSLPSFFLGIFLLVGACALDIDSADPLIAAKESAVPGAAGGKADNIPGTVTLLEARKVVGLGCYGMCGGLDVLVAVDNIAYDKRVALVYSIDGGDWRVWDGQFAGFVDSGQEEEMWSIYLPLPARDSAVQFAIAYEIDGAVYWDNNGGWDYLR